MSVPSCVTESCTAGAMTMCAVSDLGSIARRRASGQCLALVGVHKPRQGAHVAFGTDGLYELVRILEGVVLTYRVCGHSSDTERFLSTRPLWPDTIFKILNEMMIKV